MEYNPDNEVYEQLAELEEMIDDLSSWEQSFVKDMVRNHSKGSTWPMSPKQRAKIIEIHENMMNKLDYADGMGKDD